MSDITDLKSQIASLQTEVVGLRSDLQRLRNEVGQNRGISPADWTFQFIEHNSTLDLNRKKELIGTIMFVLLGRIGDDLLKSAPQELNIINLERRMCVMHKEQLIISGTLSNSRKAIFGFRDVVRQMANV